MRDRSRDNQWLSPEAYDALSVQEKRDLWARRKIEQKSNRRRQKHGSGRKLPMVAWPGWAMLAVAIAGVVAWELKPMSWWSTPVLAASGAAEIRTNFHICHTGGGTNCVVDGDTIWLEGQNIRIADIDAPETHDYRCPEEKALGDQATQRLHQLVNGGSVTLQPIGDRNVDGYGRKLRLVLVDGSNVGGTLVSEGLARYYEGGRRPWWS